jgi:DNA-directed RNA polymerase specialized sigma24 family protein
VPEARSGPEDVEKTNELLCERYLPGVFQYVSYWIKDTRTAEDLTLRTLRKALTGKEEYGQNENIFSIAVFAAVRQEVRDYLRIRPINSVWPDLSLQEQEAMALKLSSKLNNKGISKILGLSAAGVSRLLSRSLRKLTGVK